jgi:hypothetical protein
VSPLRIPHNIGDAVVTVSGGVGALKHNGINMTTTEAICYGLARRYDPFMVKNVTGFIGPATHLDSFEMILSKPIFVRDSVGEVTRDPRWGDPRQFCDSDAEFQELLSATPAMESANRLVFAFGPRITRHTPKLAGSESVIAVREFKTRDSR